MRISNTSRDLIGRCSLLACLAFLFVEAAYAIDPNRLMSQYVRDRWGAEQGFPRGPVYAIAQTPDGYLWFGLEDGLIRFDGVNFLVVRDDSKSFNVTSVLGLTADTNGDLWLRMEGSNLVRYRNGVFENPPLHSPYQRQGVTAMSRTIRGDLLASLPHLGAVAFRQNKFEPLANLEKLPRTPILALAQTADGSIWIGTRDAGLFRVRGEHVEAITKGIPDPKINCLLLDGKDALWIGTDTGIVRWNGSEIAAPAVPKSLNRFQVLSMVKDRDGNLWIGTDSRLPRFNANGLATFEDHGANQAITSVFEDREGSLWIGSTNGIERLRDSAFVSYSPAEGLPTGGNIPLFVDSENRTWFPPIEGGLWWLKDGQHGQVTQAGLNRDVVYSIAGRKGELWLGRRHGGLTQLRFEPGGIASTTYTKADGLAQDSVFAVQENRNGTVWAGTLSGGVSKFQNGKFTTYTSDSGLASNTIFSILEGSDGTMWFATPSGLSALSKGKWHTYTDRDGLPSANVNCLFEDSQGTLWVGTAAGLAHPIERGFQVPAEAPKSLRSQILGLAEDKYGSLWISTSDRVLRVNRDALLRGTVSAADIREYGLSDGLRGTEGVKRHRSVVMDSQGRIWFSMNRGLSVVDPARVVTASAPVLVHVQSITADGSSIDIRRGPVHIPPSRQRVTIGYAGLGLAMPGRVRFKYTLEGFDHGWSGPVAAREAVYTNLGPGSYRFRLIASNADGLWNSAETSISFHINPALWQTWWFRLCSVLVCALAILAAYRFRLHQLTRQLSNRFEERLAERTRIAQELHDTLLQGFLSVSMQLHIAVDNIEDNSTAKPALGRILPLMSRVIEEGRNAVRGLRSPADSSFNLEQAFSRIPEEIASDRRVRFRVIVEGPEQPLHPVLRDEVYRIGREALVNAFHHSRAKHIELELEYASRLRVLVRDDGCGIDPQVLITGREGHWGLPGMRERAERIGGQLHVWTSSGGGTEVELSVPGLIAFQARRSNGLWKRFFTRRPAGALEEK